MSDQPQAAAEPKTLFGHPRGLYVLFFTELWERFSFYGMRALLMLYMLNHFLWSQQKASQHMAWYAFLAYATPVIGGLIADKLFGAKRSVVVGAILLSIGHFLMAFEPLPYFYAALGFIIAGVGMLKPNISTQVGKLYKPGDPRRDGAFTIFYMGINLGALFGPLICGWLRLNYGWHYGFAAAGVGMLFGLMVYIIGQRKLVEFNQDVGENEENETGPHAAATPPPHVTRDRVIVLLVVFAFVILFWMAFEQSANAVIVWADKHTNLRPFNAEPPPVTLDGGDVSAAAGEGLRDFAITAEQTQSFNPFFIIALAPVFAWLWVWLHRRGWQPSTPMKMSLGIALVAVGFLALGPAAKLENGPSAAPLADLPEGVDLSKFGATRLTFDAAAGQLQMHGVLPAEDRLKLLAGAAPGELRAKVEELSGLADDKAAKTPSGEPWSVSVSIEGAPPGFSVTGEEAEKVFTWDAQSRVLSARDQIAARAEAELLATAAEPRFRAAVDAIYLASAKYRVSIWWLILHFLLITMGELCLSPVGLSLVTKMAPPKLVGLFMGGWFLATAIAEYLAHFLGGLWGTMPPTEYFFIFVVACGIGGALMALLVRSLKRMMHGVH